MPWYVLQTQTGREERLVELLRRALPEERRGDCFAAYSEQLRHRGNQNQIHVLRMFPGYVFLLSEDIGQTFRTIKKLPAMARILETEKYAFAPMHEAEADFLLGMMDPDHIVRLSYVATDGRDRVLRVSGPLEHCQGRVASYRFRKRCASVRLTVAGQEKLVPVGIILNDDVRREVAYGKVEARVEVPEHYRVRQGEATPETAGARLSPGDRACVTQGPFAGSVGQVQWARKGTLRLTVAMFGRDLAIEVPADGVAAGDGVAETARHSWDDGKVPRMQE